MKTKEQLDAQKLEMAKEYENLLFETPEVKEIHERTLKFWKNFGPQIQLTDEEITAYAKYETLRSAQNEFRKMGEEKNADAARFVLYMYKHENLLPDLTPAFRKVRQYVNSRDGRPW